MAAAPDLETIANELGELDPPLHLTFHPPAEESEFSRALLEVGEAVARAAREAGPVPTGDGRDVPATPALTVARAGRGDVHYLALPEGPEEAPFLEALVPGREPSAPLKEAESKGLLGLEPPASLLVFIASACPHCPRAVRAALRVARASTRITVTIVDAQRFPELAERYQVRSAPTTLLDGELARVGVVEADELARLILARGSEEHEFRTFNSLVETGRFDEAAERLRGGTGSRHFLAAWNDSTTSSRIPLLLSAERALEQDSEALHPVVEDLVRRLDTEDESLRGDTADLLGRIDDRRARLALEGLLSDPNPDVAEIAAEALGLDT